MSNALYLSLYHHLAESCIIIPFHLQLKMGVQWMCLPLEKPNAPCTSSELLCLVVLFAVEE